MRARSYDLWTLAGEEQPLDHSSDAVHVRRDDEEAHDYQNAEHDPEGQAGAILHGAQFATNQRCSGTCRKLRGRDSNSQPTG